METEPVKGFSQEELEKFEEGSTKFKAALSEDEIKMLVYIHLHYSGNAEEKLPDQDKIEAEAKEKLKIAGLDPDNYGQYIELKK